MRHAPAYSAERFPGDFTASAVCAAITTCLTGPIAWWLAQRYLQQTYPHHPEMLGAADITGILDGLLLGCLSFGLCFALRVWRFERRERKCSDAALLKELRAITAECDSRRGGSPPLPLR